MLFKEKMLIFSRSAPCRTYQSGFHLCGGAGGGWVPLELWGPVLGEAVSVWLQCSGPPWRALNPASRVPCVTCQRTE